MDVELSVDGFPTVAGAESQEGTGFYSLSFTDFAREKQFTFPVNEPDKRIDYMLGLNASLTHVKAVGDVQLIGTRSREDLMAATADGDGRRVGEGEGEGEQEAKKMEERRRLGVFEPRAVLWPSDVSPFKIYAESRMLFSTFCVEFGSPILYHHLALNPRLPK